MRRKTTCKKVLRAIAFAIAMMIAVACTPVRAFAVSENGPQTQVPRQQIEVEQGGGAQTSAQEQTGTETQQADPNGQGQGESQEAQTGTEVEATPENIQALINRVGDKTNYRCLYFQVIDAKSECNGNQAIITYIDNASSALDDNIDRLNTDNVHDHLTVLKIGLENRAAANTITGNLNTLEDLVEVNTQTGENLNNKMWEITDGTGNITTVEFVDTFGDEVATFNAKMQLAEEALSDANIASSESNKTAYAVQSKNHLDNANSALTQANNTISAYENTIGTAEGDLETASQNYNHYDSTSSLQSSLNGAKSKAEAAYSAFNGATERIAHFYNAGQDNTWSTANAISGNIRNDLSVLKTDISKLKVTDTPSASTLDSVGAKIEDCKKQLALAKQYSTIMQSRYNTLLTALNATGLLHVEPDPEPDPPVNNGTNTATNDPFELNPDESGSGTNDPVQINTDDTKGTSGTTVDVKPDDSGKAKESSVKVSTADADSGTITSTTVNSGATVDVASNTQESVTSIAMNAANAVLTGNSSNTSDLQKAEVVGTVKLDDSVSVEAADQASDSATIISEEAAVAVAKADAASIVAEEAPVANNEVISAPSGSQDKKPVSAGAVAGAGAATCAVGGSAFGVLKWIRRRKLF